MSHRGTGLIFGGFENIFPFFREGRGGGQANGHGDSSSKRISDIVMKTFDAGTTERYLKYVEAHTLILESLESALASEKDVKFAQVVRDFEAQKVCYLPLTTLVIKPLHRILHYDLLLERKNMSFTALFYYIFRLRVAFLFGYITRSSHKHLTVEACNFRRI